MVILVRLLQSSNAYFPIVVTLSGIVTLVRLLQFSNAYSPILVTLSGIVTLVRLLQPENAFSPIVVTLSGIVYSVAPQPIANELITPSIIKHLWSVDANLPLNSCRLRQPANALFPILVTLSGMVILVRLLQYKNAYQPISVTPSGIVTLVRLWQQ